MSRGAFVFRPFLTDPSPDARQFRRGIERGECGRRRRRRTPPQGRRGVVVDDVVLWLLFLVVVHELKETVLKQIQVFLIVVRHIPADFALERDLFHHGVVSVVVVVIQNGAWDGTHRVLL